MKIPREGNSLMAQLQSVLADMNKKYPVLACPGLTDFANQVTAQTGKAITTDQANQIQPWVGSLSSALQCQ